VNSRKRYFGSRARKQPLLDDDAPSGNRHAVPQPKQEWSKPQDDEEGEAQDQQCQAHPRFVEKTKTQSESGGNNDRHTRRPHQESKVGVNPGDDVLSISRRGCGCARAGRS